MLQIWEAVDPLVVMALEVGSAPFAPYRLSISYLEVVPAVRRGLRLCSGS